jgi:actin-like ATPase involved in cell morphogenesis
MSNLEQEYTQPVGLDIGTSRVVVARVKDKKQAYDSQLNAFLTLPYSKLAETLLQRENVFHEVQGNDIVVAGNDAEKFAEVFHVETRRPMINGVLNPEEPHSLAVVRRIITKLVGRAAAEGQKVFFSVPAQGEGLNGAIRYHEASLRQILTELGYHATPIEEGLAVVYGELAASNFSGLGISCGSGLCNICLAVLSVPVMSFSVPRAGDFIDASAAHVTGDRANRLRITKEKAFQLNGFTGDRVHNALTVYYQEVIASLVGSLRDHITAAQKLPKLEQSVPLVLSGGTAMPKGFLDHFSKVLEAEGFPLRLSEVRVSNDPLHSTARGALMAALC